jgi:outer membrane protein assembly factor BamB
MQYTRIRSLVERLHSRRAIALLAMCVVLIATSGAFAIVQLRSQRGAAAGLQALTLPGQQRWVQGGTPVSSYLFGTTDLGQEGVSPNIETSPAAQHLLKSAGVTVIRTDFPDNASDAVINLRLQTIANAGSACLGTITNPANVAFDVHLVKLASQRGCSMFEVGLSPDAAGVPVATYVAQWKALVPQLRAATSPLALTLIGPATQAENHAYIDAFLRGAKAANMLPDALSYHWFPCAQLTQATCLAQAPNVTQTVQDAQALMQQDLGTSLPIAITAWNAQFSGTPSAYVSDPAFIAPFTAAALSAMGQDGVALAAQVAAASGAGGGTLDMIGVHPVQPKAQLITMMAMVQADRPPCGTPVPTMSPPTGTGTPGLTSTAGTLTPGTTATPTAATTVTATGTLTPTPTAATTPSATVGVTPTIPVTPCPPCPTPQLPMTPTSTSTMPASPTVPVIGTATPTQAAPSATAGTTQTPVTGTPTPSPCPPTPCPSPQATPTGTGVPTITPTGTTGILAPTATASPTAITPTPGGTPCPTGSGTVAWSAFDGGGSRSGANAAETVITPATVGMLTRLYQQKLPAVVDSSPVELSGVMTTSGMKTLLYATTTAGSLLALDATTGQMIWQATTTGPKITTSSPAIDPTGQYVYSYGLDGKIHKYSSGTGQEITTGGWPVPVTLMTMVEKGSSALNIGNGYLYATESGYTGDGGHYIGHVVAIKLSTGKATVFNALCSNLTMLLQASACPAAQAGIWARAGAVIDPAPPHNIFVTTGNGAFDANTGGHNYGDSVLELSPDATRLIDSYTPSTFAQLQAGDQDLGSAAPALLPAQKGSTTPLMLVQASKDMLLRLLNRQNLSGQGGPNHLGGELQQIRLTPACQVLTQPAVWVDGQGATWVFVATGCGFSAYKVTTSAAGKSSLTLVYSNTMTGSSPFVAGGLVFVQGNLAIHALTPTTGQEVWSSAQASSRGTVGTLHWQSPIAVNGQLIVVDNSGQLTAYALPLH